MKSKNLNGIVGAKLILALLSSLALPIGVVGTVLCATNLGSALSVLGLAFFIACVLVGFYGTPMFWVSYSKYKGMVKIRQAIVDEGILDTLQLSVHCNTPLKETNRRIAALVSGGYLKGYTVDKDYTQVINLAEQQQQQAEREASNTYAVKCTNCGAQYEISSSSKKCPYCGSANNIK